MYQLFLQLVVKTNGRTSLSPAQFIWFDLVYRAVVVKQTVFLHDRVRSRISETSSIGDYWYGEYSPCTAVYFKYLTPPLSAPPSVPVRGIYRHYLLLLFHTFPMESRRWRKQSFAYLPGNIYTPGFSSAKRRSRCVFSGNIR